MIADLLRKIWSLGLKETGAAIGLAIIRNLDGPVGEQLRYAYFSKKFKCIGRDVRIDTGVFIYGPQYISIGSNVHIDKGTIIVACGPDAYRPMSHIIENDLVGASIGRGELKIGDDVHISRCCGIHAHGGIAIGNQCVLSDNCKLYSLTNLPRNPLDRTEIRSIMPYSKASPFKIGQIELKTNVWLGLNCVVMPAVRIGKDSFAQMNSVITQSFPENSYLRGDRAVRTGSRYEVIAQDDQQAAT